MLCENRAIFGRDGGDKGWSCCFCSSIWHSVSIRSKPLSPGRATMPNIVWMSRSCISTLIQRNIVRTSAAVISGDAALDATRRRSYSALRMGQEDFPGTRSTNILLKCLMISLPASLQRGSLISGRVAVSGRRLHRLAARTKEGYPDRQMPISSCITSSLR